jgi:hypothetical protein
MDQAQTAVGDAVRWRRVSAGPCVLTPLAGLPDSNVGLPTALRHGPYSFARFAASARHQLLFPFGLTSPFPFNSMFLFFLTPSTSDPGSGIGSLRRYAWARGSRRLADLR